MGQAAEAASWAIRPDAWLLDVEAADLLGLTPGRIAQLANTARSDGRGMLLHRERLLVPAGMAKGSHDGMRWFYRKADVESLLAARGGPGKRTGGAKPRAAQAPERRRPSSRTRRTGGQAEEFLLGLAGELEHLASKVRAGVDAYAREAEAAALEKVQNKQVEKMDKVLARVRKQFGLD